MTTAECTRADKLTPCRIRLVEFTYGVANDGCSTLPSAKITPAESDEIDMMLTLADEGIQCAFCSEPATHLRDGVPLCTAPIGRGIADYRLTHQLAARPAVYERK